MKPYMLIAIRKCGKLYRGQFTSLRGARAFSKNVADPRSWEIAIMNPLGDTILIKRYGKIIWNKAGWKK